MPITSSAVAVDLLLEALERNITRQEDLAVILDRERERLIAVSFEGLMQVEVEKETALEQIRIQARAVQSCMKELGQALGASDSDATTLSGLVRHLGPLDRSRVRKTQERLLELTRTVREQNRINDRLIHGSLSYVSQYMNFLRVLTAGPPRYAANGGMSAQQESGRLVALKG
jgi:flagellar biosynthesis/type III secretory pathway chaperone